MNGAPVIDTLQRREMLRPQPNPGGKDDYVITLRGRLRPAPGNRDVTIVVRYIPDKLILKPEHFETYLDAIEARNWDSVEQIAVTVAKDMGNEIVTRWVQVALRSDPESAPGIGVHQVTVEDRQPGWRNDDLLWRLAPIE